MSRARNIKPGFFKNEVLAECSPLARILFIGLWCLADRRGRLELRHKRIRAELLPYDDCSVSDLINELHLHGFVSVYEVGGEPFLQIVKFEKHQHPHVKESDSTIPAPDSPDASPVLAQGRNGAGTKAALKLPAAKTPDSLLLIPDSLKLIPQKPVKKKNTEGGRGKSR